MVSTTITNILAFNDIKEPTTIKTDDMPTFLHAVDSILCFSVLFGDEVSFVSQLSQCMKEALEEKPPFIITPQELKIVFRMFDRIRHFTSIIKMTNDVVRAMVEILPGLEKKWQNNKLVGRNLATRTQDIRDEIEILLDKRAEDQREIDKLRKSMKSVTLKEKKLEEAEALVFAAREEKSAREDKLRNENSRLQSELANLKIKLEAANAEPDKVREEFSGKMRRLHDRVSARDKTIAEKDKIIAEQDQTIEKTKSKIVELKAACKKL